MKLHLLTKGVTGWTVTVQYMKPHYEHVCHTLSNAYVSEGNESKEVLQPSKWL